MRDNESSLLDRIGKGLTADSFVELPAKYLTLMKERVIFDKVKVYIVDNFFHDLLLGLNFSKALGFSP